MSILDVENPRIGIRIQEASGSHSIIRLLRNESLRLLPRNGMMKLFDALVARPSLVHPLKGENQGGYMEMVQTEALPCTVLLVFKLPDLVASSRIVHAFPLFPTVTGEPSSV